jgi:hypothetical protein
MQFARQPGLKKAQAADQRKMAANHLIHVIKTYDPTDPRLRYGVADALRPVEDAEYQKLWRQEAERALELDLKAGASPHSLTEDQRTQLMQWLKPAKAPER